MFHKGYLERLSQTADIALVADNSITINDLTANGGDGVLALSAGRNLSLTTTTGNITMLNTANTLRTNGGTITASAGGSLTLGNLDTTGNGATATGAAISLTGSSLTLGGNIQTGTSGSLLARSTTGNLTTTAALNGLQGAALFKSANNLTISGGDITTTTGSNPYTFLAQGDITFLSSVQHGGSGDVNVVAGWDGTTEASAASSYGITRKIEINRWDNIGGDNVYVGSRDGSTNVVGNNIRVRASDYYAAANDPKHARIGYSTNTTATGDIFIRAIGDLQLNSRYGKHAIIGHGAHGVGGNLSGNIDVQALSIDIHATDKIVFANPPYNGFFQSKIGHGGRGNTATINGNITVTANDINVESDGYISDAHIGHGGEDADGNFTGDIAINSTTLSLLAGNTRKASVQIGHGGNNASGLKSGNITITNSGDLLLSGGGGGGPDAYAQIGHGAAMLSAAGDRIGNIIISVGGELSIVDNNQTAYIGHLSSDGSSAISNANIRISAGSLDFADDTPGNGFVINDANFASRMAANLQGGDVTIISTNPGGGSSFGWQTPFTATGATHRLSLISARAFGTSQPINTGNGQFFGMSGWNGSSGLNSDGSIDLATIRLKNVGTSSDFSIGPAGSITSGYAGDAIIIASEDNFINSNTAPASSVLSTPNGRYTLYSATRANNTMNNLNPTRQVGVSYGDDISAYSTGNYLFYVSASGGVRLVPVSQTYTYNGSSQFSVLYGTGYVVNNLDIAKLTADGYSTTDFNNSLSAGLGFAIDSIALGSANTTDAFSASKDITLTGSLTSSLGYTINLDNSVVGDYLINPKAISAVNGITAINKTYDGLTTASLNTGSASFAGIVGGDTLAVATATGAFSDKNAGNAKTVNITGLSLGGADAGNYTLANTTASTTADINKALLTLTPAAQRYTYNATASQFNDVDYTLSGFVNGETLGTSGVAGLGLVSASDKVNAGTRDITASTGTLNASNYSFIANTLNNGLGIAKADLTIDVNDASRQVGQQNPNFTYLVTGLKGSDAESVINNLNVTTPASLNSPAGTYAITAQNAQAQNYSFTYQNGILKLLPVTPTTPNQPIATAINLPSTVEQVSQNIRGSRGSNDLTNNNFNSLNRSNPYNTAATLNNKTVFQKGIIPVATDITDIIIDKDTLNNTRLIMHPELAKKLGYEWAFIVY